MFFSIEKLDHFLCKNKKKKKMGCLCCKDKELDPLQLKDPLSRNLDLRSLPDYAEHRLWVCDIAERKGENDNSTATSYLMAPSR